MAVYSRQEGIDPVGACVGLRGIRIQNVVNELNGERIDVVQWDPDPSQFVANALSPAQVHEVHILPDGTTAEVIVGDRQLSLAIGKEGQNARLAAKLTGLRIDIKSLAAEESEEEPALQISAEPDVKRETPIWEELAQEEAAAAAAAAAIQPVASDDASVEAPAATIAEAVSEPAAPPAEQAPAAPGAKSRPRPRFDSLMKSCPPSFRRPRHSRDGAPAVVAVALVVAAAERKRRRGADVARCVLVAAPTDVHSMMKLKKSWKQRWKAKISTSSA